MNVCSDLKVDTMPCKCCMYSIDMHSIDIFQLPTHLLSTHAPTIYMKIKEMKKRDKKKCFFFFFNLQGSNLCHEGFLHSVCIRLAL